MEREDTRVSFHLMTQIQIHNIVELVVIEATKSEGKQGKRKQRASGVVSMQRDFIVRNPQS